MTLINTQNKSDADLHIHSNCSDGLLSPDEIVEYSSEIDLKTIAITDHDSVQAIDLLRNTDHREVELIPAVELSANIGKLDIHILGYFVDHENSDLRAYLEKLRAHRIERARKIVENLSNDGIKVDFDRMKAIAKNSALGRPHIAEALREHGYVQSIREAFVRFLSYHSPYYEPKMSVGPQEILEKIKRWQGIPVIAHPGIYNDNSLVHGLIAAGAVGLEVWHPDHSPVCQQELYELASAEGLLMTGGSDCHGHRRSSLQIGRCGCGQVEVRCLKDYRNRSRE
ncbi:MAG: PHP domain-containing protein [candidate division WOR-3 bacterium]